MRLGVEAQPKVRAAAQRKVAAHRLEAELLVRERTRTCRRDHRQILRALLYGAGLRAQHIKYTRVGATLLYCLLVHSTRTVHVVFPALSFGGV